MMMQERERIVIETLKKIPKRNVILIGGYAVNAYAPPRFSVDCDLVVFGRTKAVETVLSRQGFVKTEEGDVLYGSYIRYFMEKEKVSFDLLVNSVLDRETGIFFEGELLKKNSKVRITVGRANPVRIKMKIIDPEFLFAMKFITARKQDIRDIFMLAGEDLKWDLVTKIVSGKCSSELIKKRRGLIKRSIHSKSYRDSIHGPYGKMPDERFDLCRNRLIGFLGRL